MVSLASVGLHHIDGTGRIAPTTIAWSTGRVGEGHSTVAGGDFRILPVAWGLSTVRNSRLGVEQFHLPNLSPRLPEGRLATYGATGPFKFPIAPITTKAIYHVHDMTDPAQGWRLIETRILLRRQSGWIGLPYDYSP